MSIYNKRTSNILTNKQQQQQKNTLTHAYGIKISQQNIKRNLRKFETPNLLKEKLVSQPKQANVPLNFNTIHWEALVLHLLLFWSKMHKYLRTKKKKKNSTCTWGMQNGWSQWDLFQVKSTVLDEWTIQCRCRPTHLLVLRFTVFESTPGTLKVFFSILKWFLELFFLGTFYLN